MPATVKKRSKRQTAPVGARPDEWADRLFASAGRLKAKGLAQAGIFSHSLRIPGRPEMRLCGFSAGSHRLKKPTAVSMLAENNSPTRSNGAAASAAEQEIHRFLYGLRPDAGAIIRFQPPWASMLIGLKEPMPLVFDEQCRQLGPALPLSVPGGIPTEADHQAIGLGSNVYTWGDSVVVLGVTLEKAVFNAELLEKCAKAFILARATGGKIRPIPWWVRKIAHKRLLKDQARAAESYSRGEEPGGFTAY